MSWRRTLSKIRFLVLRRRDDLAEEIRTHLAMEEAENMAAGMEIEEAQVQARLRFGKCDLGGGEEPGHVDMDGNRDAPDGPSVWLAPIAA